MAVAHGHMAGKVEAGAEGLVQCHETGLSVVGSQAPFEKPGAVAGVGSPAQGGTDTQHRAVHTARRAVGAPLAGVKVPVGTHLTTPPFLLPAIPGQGGADRQGLGVVPGGSGLQVQTGTVILG